MAGTKETLSIFDELAILSRVGIGVKKKLRAYCLVFRLGGCLMDVG